MRLYNVWQAYAPKGGYACHQVPFMVHLAKNKKGAWSLVEVRPHQSIPCKKNECYKSVREYVVQLIQTWLESEDRI